jgi:hypothetical protein
MHAVRSRCFAALRASARRATSATSRLSRRPHHHRANASRRARATRRYVSSATTTRETGEDASRGGRFLTASPTEEGPDDRRRRHRAHALPAFGDVLLLGEGDFSFSRALVESASVGVGRVTATSLESAAEIETRWGGAANVDALRRASNVEIVHGVDATALETTLPDPGRRFDKVRSIQKFFTHRPVSTLDRVPFQLTGELFLYGMSLRSASCFPTSRGKGASA